VSEKVSVKVKNQIKTLKAAFNGGPEHNPPICALCVLPFFLSEKSFQGSELFTASGYKIRQQATPIARPGQVLCGPSKTAHIRNFNSSKSHFARDPATAFRRTHICSPNWTKVNKKVKK